MSARRDRQTDDRSTRVARHLVEIDLEVKLFALEALANRGRQYTPGLQDLSRQDSWDKHAEQLYRELESSSKADEQSEKQRVAEQLFRHQDWWIVPLASVADVEKA